MPLERTCRVIFLAYVGTTTVGSPYADVLPRDIEVLSRVAKVEPIGDGLLVVLAGSPDEWRNAEYGSRVATVRQLLGEDLFLGSEHATSTRAPEFPGSMRDGVRWAECTETVADSIRTLRQRWLGPPLSLISTLTVSKPPSVPLAVP